MELFQLQLCRIRRSFYFHFASPHQCESSMSRCESSCPRGERIYFPLSVFFSRIPDSTSSWSRSVRIFVFAHPTAFPISVKVVAPLSTACMMKIIHFFPRRVKRAWAFGHAHWGFRTIWEIVRSWRNSTDIFPICTRLCPHNIFHFFSKAKLFAFSSYLHNIKSLYFLN